MRILARLASLAVVAAAALAAPAAAAPLSFDGLVAPIVRVNLREARVVIRTWNQPSIEVDAPDSVDVRRFSIGNDRTPAGGSIPIFAGQIRGPGGPVTLPAETFVVSSLPAGRRDVVLVRDASGAETGSGPVDVRILIPRSTSLAVVQVGRGMVAVDGYRTGTIVSRVRAGAITYTGDGGDAFAQTLRGPIRVISSSFGRLRARSALGALYFERCNAQQIDVSNVDGPIVYDDGTFSPGLARFESQHGDVAVGTSGPALLSARSGSGRVFTSFAAGTHVDGGGGQASATVAGGGPVVTAQSASGRVFVYDGAIAARDHVDTAWKAPLGVATRLSSPAATRLLNERRPTFAPGLAPRMPPRVPQATRPPTRHRRR